MRGRASLSSPFSPDSTTKSSKTLRSGHHCETQREIRIGRETNTTGGLDEGGGGAIDDEPELRLPEQQGRPQTGAATRRRQLSGKLFIPPLRSEVVVVHCRRRLMVRVGDRRQPWQLGLPAVVRRFAPSASPEPPNAGNLFPFSTSVGWDEPRSEPGDELHHS